MAIEPGVNGARSVARRGSGSGGAERRRRRIHVVQVLGNAIGGGMERWVLDIVARLPRERFKVSCVCPFESPCTAAMRELGCEVYIAPMHDEPRWRSIQLLVEVIRHFGVDLLHAHMPAAHVLAGLAGGLTGTPVLATIHGMNVAGHQPHDRHVPDDGLPGGVHPGAGDGRALRARDTRAQRRRRRAVPPGPRWERLPRRHRRPPGVPLVGFVGRLAPEKGPDLFVQAAAVALRRRPNLQFVLVGDGDLWERLQGEIERLGLAERVHLAGEWSDTAEVYPALDLLAQTSRSEGMPLALLEAMACGVPAVALGVGGVPEIVGYGTTGLLKGPGDWNGIGEIIPALLDDPERLRRMRAAARERAVRHFDVRRSAEQVAALLERLGSADYPVAAAWAAEAVRRTGVQPTP